MADEIEVKDKRRGFLEKLLGPLAGKTREELREAESLLDGAGIARKAEGETEPPANPPPPPAPEEMHDDPGDMLAKVSSKVAADLMVSLRDKLGNVTEEELSAAIYTALEAPADDPEGEGEVTPPEEEQIMDSKSLAPEEQKAYADSFASMVKDMSDTARYVQTMAEAQKATADTQKSILDAVNSLVGRMDAIEQKVNDRPRSASQAAETLIDPTSDAAKALQDAIKKTQAGSDKRVLGVRVSD